MRVDGWLYVTKNKNVRWLKTRQAPNQNELRIAVSIDIPNAFFERPEFIAKIEVPADHIPGFPMEAAIEIAASAVGRGLGINVADVHDGLLDAARKSGVPVK